MIGGRRFIFFHMENLIFPAPFLKRPFLVRHLCHKLSDYAHTAGLSRRVSPWCCIQGCHQWGEPPAPLFSSNAHWPWHFTFHVNFRLCQDPNETTTEGNSAGVPTGITWIWRPSGRKATPFQLQVLVSSWAQFSRTTGGQATWYYHWNAGGWAQAYPVTQQSRSWAYTQRDMYTCAPKDACRMVMGTAQNENTQSPSPPEWTHVIST